jgi:two-component system, chemotaxis family, chemotaxis protein CheY
VKTALIVEPDPQSAKLLGVVLQQAGFETQAVGSAEAAMTLLGSLRFHVVITELELPVMTGLGLIQAIRSTPAIQETPIVVATSNHGHETKRVARAAGCNKFTAKPIEGASFGAQVLDLIGQRP